MPTAIESLRSFLQARRVTHNGPDLLDRWTPAMETQVNVAAGKGEPVAGKRNTFTDGIIDELTRGGFSTVCKCRERAKRLPQRPVRRLDSAKQVRKPKLILRMGNRPHHAGFPRWHGQRVEPPPAAMGKQRRNERRAAFVPRQGKRQLECPDTTSWKLTGDATACATSLFVSERYNGSSYHQEHSS